MSYTSTVEEVNSTRRKFRINVDKTLVAASFGRALSEVQKTAQIKGFRKGKVPPQLVRKFFADDVRKKAMEDVFQQTYGKASQESQLQIVSFPNVDNVGTFEDGQDWVYEATVDVNPAVEIKSYKGLKLNLAKSDALDVDKQVMQTRDNFLRNSGHIEAVTDRDLVATGDYVTLDYRILEGETALEGQQRKGARMALNGSNLPEVEKGLVGARLGMAVSFPVTFPETHPDQALKGKTLIFEATVRKIEVLKLPELDDTFVKKFGFGAVADFETSLKETVARSVKRHRLDLLRTEIVKQILASNPFEVPESLIDNTIDRAIDDANSRRSKSEQLKKDDASVRGVFREKSLDEVRGVLALGHIARIEQLKVDEAAVAEEIALFARENGIPPQEVIRRYGSQIVEEFRGKVLIDKVVELIVEQATVEEV